MASSMGALTIEISSIINNSSFFKSFLNRGSFDSWITGKVSNPILKAELMVLPPIFKAATPVGATTIFLRLHSSTTLSIKVVLPVPAAPVKYINCWFSDSSNSIT